MKGQQETGSKFPRGSYRRRSPSESRTSSRRESREREPVGSLARPGLVVGIAPAAVVLQALNAGLDGLFLLAARLLALQMRAEPVVFEHPHQFGDVIIHHRRFTAYDNPVLTLRLARLVPSLPPTLP